jgi:hypothetical protein
VSHFDLLAEVNRVIDETFNNPGWWTGKREPEQPEAEQRLQSILDHYRGSSTFQGFSQISELAEQERNDDDGGAAVCA